MQVLLMVCFLIYPVAAPDQKPALADVLEAAAQYVVKHADRMAIVEGEEQFTQHDTSTGVLTGSRRLVSDIVLVGLNDGRMASFRDVFEVDGNAMRERKARLVDLLRAQVDEAALDRAKTLSESSLRHYLSSSLHVMDDPTLPLELVRRVNRERFSFKLDGVRTMDGSQVAVVRFTEQGRERFIEFPGNVPLTGRLWIDVATGAVRQAELSVTGKDFNMKSTTNYKAAAALDLLLPSELVITADIRGPGATGISNMGEGGNRMRQSLEARILYSKYKQAATVAR